MRGWLARLIRLILFVALVAGIVVGAQYLPEHLTEALALFLLLPILGIAIRWGMPEAIITALAASFFFDYFFLPPLGTLGPQTLSDWVTTATFLTVAISTSRLSTQARRRAREATARRVEMERLYMFGQATLQSGSLEATIHTGLEQILDIFGGDGVAFHDAASDRIVRAGKESARLADADLREVTRTEARRADAGSSTAIVPVRLGDVRIGSLGFVGAVFTDTTVTAVGHRLGVALERTRALEKEGAAESARKAQELKSTVLDALAHGVKTPLTTIRLAASSLLSQPQGAAPHQLELLEAIDQEATRLQLFVDEALQLAQIDAGLLRMEKEFHDVRALIDASIGDLQAAMQGRTVEVTCAGDLPAAPFDFRLLKLVLKELLTNANKYSPPAAPLVVGARLQEDAIVISVMDGGVGIEPSEQPHIFERYYRARASHPSSGSGLGLALVKNLVEAHHGKIWVQSQPGAGSAFYFSVPLPREAVHETRENPGRRRRPEDPPRDAHHPGRPRL